MKMKSIIASALFMAGLVVMSGCSTDTIWEEVSYGQEVPAYSNGELPAMVTVYKDRAEVKLYKDLTHYIYLDGVFIKEVKQHSNENKVVLRALTPNTEYHLLITALEGENMLTKEETFTTHKSYATVTGWREMDPYGNNEEVVSLVRPMPGGDFLDIAHKYMDFDDDNYRLRRTDAYGQVRWRSNIWVDDASVSEEGDVAAWSYCMAYRVDAETGSVLYTYSRKTNDYLISGACACKDGGMAIVGMNSTESKYYFARLDANGQLIHEEEGDLANELYIVHETADGNMVAMGRKGDYTFVAITFDASGNVIGTSSDYSEYRDLGYLAYFKQAVRDEVGNIYFLGGVEISTKRGYAPAAIVVKVDAQGKMAWIRTLSNEYDEFYATSMNFIDNDRLCVIYSGKSTHVALMTTENDLLQDTSLNANYNAVYGGPVNDEITQFVLFDTYGRIIYIDTEGD